MIPKKTFSWWKNEPVVVEYEKIPDYGDKMTLKIFIESCKDGSLIDYDGHGYYAFKNKMSNIMVHPSDITSGKILRDFTHVVWFNK